MFIFHFSESTSGNVLFISRHSYIGPLSMTRMQFWPNDPFFRSFKVIWGHIRFLPVTFDRTEMERWEWSQCVSLAQTHRLVCNITYLAQHVTSRDLELRSNSDIGLLRSICTYTFRHVSTRGTRCCHNYATSFLSSKDICENPFLQKSAILTFLDLCSLTRWS